MRALIRKLLGLTLLSCLSSSVIAQTWTQVTTGLPLGAQTTTGSGGSVSNYFQVTGIGPSGGSGSLFVGIGANGVYRSDNNGASWTEANGGLKDTFSGRTLDALAFHKTGGAVLRLGSTASWNNHGQRRLPVHGQWRHLGGIDALRWSELRASSRRRRTALCRKPGQRHRPSELGRTLLFI
jgi:hypothetical protein